MLLCVYSLSKDGNGNISAAGITVLLKLESLKKYPRKQNQRNKKVFAKTETFHQQIRQGPHNSCSERHFCISKLRVRVSYDEKYNILTLALHDPVKSFNGKIYVCKTCRKHLSRNELPCHTVCEKIEIDPTLNKSKYVPRLKKIDIRKGFCVRK